MKIVFFGTPDFAVGSLQALVEGGFEVTGVVTQPDREKGRGREVVMSPVKAYAVEKNIPVFQPEKIKRPEAVEELKKWEADLYVVAAFGQILSQEILDIPRYGCINVHASLLPKYRGAAPIQWSILNGDSVTGVTIMQMELGLDSGAILTQTTVPIAPKETGDSLFDKLCVAGARLLVETIPMIEKGEITPIPQDESAATHVKMLTKGMGKMDFIRTAVELDRQVRGFNSWPGAYCYFNDKTLKVWDADAESKESLAAQGIHPADVESGCAAAVTKDAVYIRCQEGYLRLNEVQPESKKRMATKDFLLGYPVAVGDRFKA
jgi:methionyl-tRNA formyltransferase